LRQAVVQQKKDQQEKSKPKAPPKPTDNKKAQKDYTAAAQAYHDAVAAGQGKKQQFENFLSTDSTYVGQEAALNKELQDYITSNEDQRRRATEDYNTATSRMGQERTSALERMKNDYAARGLLNSSEFTGAQGEYDRTYNQQLGDLTNSNNRTISDILESLGLFKSSNANTLAEAKAEAIRRRTEQFGDYTPDSAVAPTAPKAPKGTKASMEIKPRGEEGGRRPHSSYDKKKDTLNNGFNNQGRQPVKPKPKKK
jgi:hypothetical protein